MTGPEHYKEGEHLLQSATDGMRRSGEVLLDHNDASRAERYRMSKEYQDDAMAFASLAALHFQAAQVAATVNGTVVGLQHQERDAWREAVNG